MARDFNNVNDKFDLEVYLVKMLLFLISGLLIFLVSTEIFFLIIGTILVISSISRLSSDGALSLPSESFSLS